MRFYQTVLSSIVLLVVVPTSDAADTFDSATKELPKIFRETTVESCVRSLSEERAPRDSLGNIGEEAFMDLVPKAPRYDPIEFNNHPNLKWKQFKGSVEGAVNIYNSYCGRHDYVCQPMNGNEVGFYNSRYGNRCFFPRYHPKLYSTEMFYILENKDDFVPLKWVEGSYGSVPSHAVKADQSPDGYYVAKNAYGWGSLHRNDAFYLPWIDFMSSGVVYGYSTWYKRSYQVLVINNDKYEQQMKEFKYDIDNASVPNTPPYTVNQVEAVNKDCSPVKVAVNIETTETKTNTWETSYSMGLSVSTTLSVGIPMIGDGEITVGMEQTFTTSSSFSISQTITSSLETQITVDPNEVCTISMMGKKFAYNIPYTALLGRTYQNGETKWTHISGTYKGVQVADFFVQVEACKPLDNPTPCT